MAHATYRVTNETRDALEAFIDDLIDVAAQGNAPTPTWAVQLLENVLEDGHYEAPRDADGRVVDE